jgi:hypothetical protein
VPVEQSSTLRVCWRHEVSAKQAERCSYSENGHKRPVPVTDSATFTTPEAGDEDLGDLLLEVLPPNSRTSGNQMRRRSDSLKLDMFSNSYQMRLSLLRTAVLVALAYGNMAHAQSVVEPEPTHPICTYGNRIKGTKKTFPCRVIIDGRSKEVIFIDEYASKSKSSKLVARHDEKREWYAPAMRKSECLLRGQGAEYICIGRPWTGI